jgi:hypothetical protein
MTLDPNNARAGVPPSTPQDLVLARLHGVLDGGAFEHPWNRLQAIPLKNPGLCKVLRLPSGDMESPNVPKQPRNLTIDIN